MAAGTDVGIVALDWTNAGDRALNTRHLSTESHEPETGQEVGRVTGRLKTSHSKVLCPYHAS